MKLFISHASEDKKTFVAELAKALTAHHEVWYDEYELVVGDSLREQIDKGLLECDYGVVVLSPHFFSKKWPKDELDGLFALEGARGKMILPVWKDVGMKDVLKFSPLLAGRMGTETTHGVSAVVNALVRSVEVSERRKALNKTTSIIDEFREIDASIDTRNQAFALVHNEKGVRLADTSFSQIRASLAQYVAQISENKNVKLTIHDHDAHCFEIATSFGIRARLWFRDVALNSLSTARLEFKVMRLGSLIPLGNGDRNEPQLQREDFFTVDFAAGETCMWLHDGHEDRAMTDDEVVQHVLMFLKGEARGASRR